MKLHEGKYKVQCKYHHFIKVYTSWQWLGFKLLITLCFTVRMEAIIIIIIQALTITMPCNVRTYTVPDILFQKH